MSKSMSPSLGGIIALASKTAQVVPPGESGWPDGLTPEVIGQRMLAAAASELPPPALQDLQAVWDRYLGLQRHAWQRVVLPADPSSWRPALEERQSVRRWRFCLPCCAGRWMPALSGAP